jgi:hypothetical protein
MIRASSLRFVLVVSPPAVWMVIAFGASILLGAVTLWLNPADVDSAFGSILLLQMFSASSGFAAPAGRGYFDPLLVGGRSRLRVALGSLVASTLPGLTAWTVVVLVAVGLGRGGTALTFHRQVALILVSAIAWAAGLPLPRMAAGGLWAFVLLTAALSRGTIGDFLVVVQSAPAGLQAVLASASAFALCPYLLLGEFPAARNLMVLCADLLLAGAMVWAGVSYVCRREYALGEPV